MLKVVIGLLTFLVSTLLPGCQKDAGRRRGRFLYAKIPTSISCSSRIFSAYVLMRLKSRRRGVIGRMLARVRNSAVSSRTL